MTQYEQYAREEQVITVQMRAITETCEWARGPMLIILRAALAKAYRAGLYDGSSHNQ